LGWFETNETGQTALRTGNSVSLRRARTSNSDELQSASQISLLGAPARMLRRPPEGVSGMLRRPRAQTGCCGGRGRRRDAVEAEGAGETQQRPRAPLRMLRRQRAKGCRRLGAQWRRRSHRPAAREKERRVEFTPLYTGKMESGVKPSTPGNQAAPSHYIILELNGLNRTNPIETDDNGLG
jgi:hypothetical protein